MSTVEPDYRNLQEQYNTMHNDYHNKVTEVLILRNDLTKFKQQSERQCLLLKKSETLLEEARKENKTLEAENYKGRELSNAHTNTYAELYYTTINYCVCTLCHIT